MFNNKRTATVWIWLAIFVCISAIAPTCSMAVIDSMMEMPGENSVQQSGDNAIWDVELYLAFQNVEGARIKQTEIQLQQISMLDYIYFDITDELGQAYFPKLPISAYTINMLDQEEQRIAQLQLNMYPSDKTEIINKPQINENETEARSVIGEDTLHSYEVDIQKQAPYGVELVFLLTEEDELLLTEAKTLLEAPVHTPSPSVTPAPTAEPTKTSEPTDTISPMPSQTVSSAPQPTKEQTYQLKVLKLDATTGTGIAQTRFAVKNDKGRLIGRLITDVTGSAVFKKKLTEGVYTIVETKAADGYQLTKDRNTVDVTIPGPETSGSTATVIIKNSKSPKPSPSPTQAPTASSPMIPPAPTLAPAPTTLPSMVNIKINLMNHGGMALSGYSVTIGSGNPVVANADGTLYIPQIDPFQLKTILIYDQNNMVIGKNNIRFIPAERTLIAAVDEDGTYTINYKKDQADIFMNIVVNEGGTENTRFTITQLSNDPLTPGKSVESETPEPLNNPRFSGYLLNMSGEPIGQSEIASKNNDTQNTLAAITDREGFFTIAGISKGNHTITAKSAEGEDIGQIELDVVFGDKTFIRKEKKKTTATIRNGIEDVYAVLQDYEEQNLQLIQLTEDKDAAMLVLSVPTKQPEAMPTSTQTETEIDSEPTAEVITPPPTESEQQESRAIAIPIVITAIIAGTVIAIVLYIRRRGNLKP